MDVGTRSGGGVGIRCDWMNKVPLFAGRFIGN